MLTERIMDAYSGVGEIRVRIIRMPEYTLLPYLVAPDGSELIQWGLVIVFPLIVLSALGVLIVWGISAGRMKKTHRLLKGISE